MENILKKMERLGVLHDKIDAKMLAEKNIKLRLRNADGSGVVAGLKNCSWAD